MKVKDLDGNTSTWALTGHLVREETRPRSSYHMYARKVIRDCFPTGQVLEEVPIKVYFSSTQYLDFYLPLNRIAIEVHGEQHYTFNTLFHSNMSGFLHQKKLDRQKIEWCEINGINYVELKFNEQDQWNNLIKL